MKKGLKKIYLFVFIPFVCMLFTDNFAFAENSSCKTCFSSPSQLSDYISTMKSAVSSVSSISPSSDASSKVVGSLKVYTDILTSIPMEYFGQDLLSNIKVVFNGYAAVRDRKKVLDLDKSIGDAVRKVAESGKYDTQISDGDISKFNTIMTNIKFIKNFQIKQGATYGELISVLWQIHKLYKEAFLAVSYTNSSENYDLESYIKKAFKGYEGKFTSQGDYPSIDSSYLEDMKNAYECSLGPNVSAENSCSSQLDKFFKNMESITKTLEDADKIFEKFSDSRKKLQDALKGIGSTGFKGEYADRHVKFKAEIQGQPIKDLLDTGKTSGLWSIGKLVQKGEDIKNSLRDIDADKADNFIGQAKDSGSSENNKQEDPNTQGVFKKELKTEYVDNMKNAFDSTLKAGQSMADDVPVETPDPSPTTQFPDLSKNVYKARKAAKEVQQKMGEACENQCKNVDVDCGKND